MANTQCQSCKYRNRTLLEEPCATGIYQLRYGKWCNLYKKSLWAALKEKMQERRTHGKTQHNSEAE